MIMASTVADNEDLYHEPVYTLGHAAKKLGVPVQTSRL